MSLQNPTKYKEESTLIICTRLWRKKNILVFYSSNIEPSSLKFHLILYSFIGVSPSNKHRLLDLRCWVHCIFNSLFFFFSSPTLIALSFCDPFSFSLHEGFPSTCGPFFLGSTLTSKCHNVNIVCWTWVLRFNPFFMLSPH